MNGASKPTAQQRAEAEQAEESDGGEEGEEHALRTSRAEQLLEKRLEVSELRGERLENVPKVAGGGAPATPDWMRPPGIGGGSKPQRDDHGERRQSGGEEGSRCRRRCRRR